MTQGVERRDSRAHQRRGVFEGKAVRNGGHRLRGRYHVLGISAVMGELCNFTIVTIHQIAAAAGDADATVPSVPTHAHALAFFPGCDGGADLTDHSGYCVARHERILQAGPKASYRKRIAMANTAGVDTDANPIWFRGWNLSVNNL